MAKKKHVYNKFVTKEKWNKVNKINKEIMEDYRAELEANQKSQGTIKQYLNDWKIVFVKIMEDYENKSILDMDRKEFRRLSTYFKNSCNHSNSRVNRIMSAIKSILNYCEDAKEWEYDYNTASKVKGLKKIGVREIVFIEDEQVQKLYAKLEEDGEYQLATILALAYESAGRKNELFQVEKNNFLNNKRYTNKVVGKRSKIFRLVYGEKTLYFAKKYLEERGKDSNNEMWTSKDKDGNYEAVQSGTIYKWFKTMSKILSEIEGEEIDFNVHSFRHSALDNLSTGEHYLCKEYGKPDGFSLEDLQKYAHHESSDTTSSYLQNRDDEVVFGMFGIEE